MKKIVCLLVLLVSMCSLFAQKKNAIHIDGGLPIGWDRNTDESFNNYTAYCISGQYSREILSPKLRMNIGYKYKDFRQKTNVNNNIQSHYIYVGEGFSIHKYHNLSIEAAVNIGYAIIKRPAAIITNSILEGDNSSLLMRISNESTTLNIDAFYFNTNIGLRFSLSECIELKFSVGYDRCFPFDLDKMHESVFDSKLTFQSVDIRLGLGFVF
jgi:hypothetical protein